MQSLLPPDEVDTHKIPPPLERLSAEKFRQWLAGMVSQDAPQSQTDRESMRESLIKFLGSLPLVYGIPDRLSMWEKIGNSAIAALDTCDGDLSKWINDVLAGVQASAGAVATKDGVRKAIVAMEEKTESWQSECLLVMKDLRFSLPAFAREQWTETKEAALAGKNGETNGRE